MNLHDSVRRQYGVPLAGPLAGLDPRTADQAEDLCRTGKVISVREAEPGRLDATVRGSNGESYLAAVRLGRTPDGLHVTATCNCPATSQCPHGAAALLAWLREGGALATPADGAAQRSNALFRRQHALRWARDLASVKLPGAAGEAEGSRLFYVLGCHDRDARLSVYRAQILGDGSYSEPERYGALGDRALTPPGFWSDTDRMVALFLLQEERPAGDSHSLHGPRARDALMALARAGRLYANAAPRDCNEPSLQAGPPLATSIAWLDEAPAGESEERSLRLGLAVAPPAIAIYSPEPCYLDLAAGVIGPLEVDAPAALLRWLREAPPVPAEAAPEVAMALHALYLNKPALRESVPDMPAQQVRELTPAPRFVLGLFTTDTTAFRNRPRTGTRSYLAISLAVEYAGQRTEPLRVATLALQSEDGPVLLVCDRPAERLALAGLRDVLSQAGGQEEGFKFAPVRPPGGAGSGASSGWLTVATVPADSITAARIKHEVAPRLAQDGWLIADHSELPTAVVGADALVVDLQQGDVDGSHRSTADWFQLQSGIQVGAQRIDLAPLLATILAAGGFDAWARSRCPHGVLWMKVSEAVVLRLETARIEPLARVVADWAQWRDADPDGDDEAVVLLSPFAAAQLAASVPTATVPPAIHHLRSQVSAFRGLQPVTAPDSFLAELRPYQQHGLAWLQFIARAGLGGVLADDMGLGKTIQLLAHIDCERAAGRLSGPVLVVAPTSVIFNWRAEAARHAPALQVLALTGPGRSRHFEALESHQLVLTSYALLPRDASALREVHWHAIVLDEAQMIKNPRTQAASVVRNLRAQHRIAMTGTPLENHIGELWSIMHFVLPGLLGPDEAFRNRFRTPIEKQPGTDLANERLRSLEGRIRPFMLRRTKQSVLADLPPRTEIVQRVDLPPEQRDLYESIRAAMDKRVREALASAGIAKSQIVLLDALLKLRQVCCDPALVKLPAARRPMRSAKREALIELLATLVDEGRKALVFSQFTSMLDLIETAIDADPRFGGVSRSRLDGGTADRGGAVEQFQAGDAQLFLLSLKAGGVGLNLTAADTVIHYDPWWNPAVQNQATDRAHRIGQQKPVFVYKLIVAGTVEERILSLQERKAELAQAVLSGSLTAAGQPLSQEDLLRLFEPF